MTEYDTQLDHILNIKDEDMTEKITDVGECNKLSLNDFDKR